MSVYKKDIDSYQNILDKIRNGFDTLVFNSVEEKCMLINLLEKKIEELKRIDSYCDYWHNRTYSDWTDPRL